MMVVSRYFPLLTALALVGGCADNQAEEEGLGAQFYTDLPMQVLMNGVIQHAAEDVWDRTGYIMDDEGFRSVFPQGEEEWHDAKVASQAVAEVTNILLLPGRRVDAQDWDDAVVAVREAALAAAAAAEDMDEERFMAAALEINDGCASCHEAYDPTS